MFARKFRAYFSAWFFMIKREEGSEKHSLERPIIHICKQISCFNIDKKASPINLF
jgi:hypothetical protein